MDNEHLSGFCKRVGGLTIGQVVELSGLNRQRLDAWFKSPVYRDALNLIVLGASVVYLIRSDSSEK